MSNVSFENDILTVSSIATNTSPYTIYQFSINSGDIIRLNAIIMDENGQIVIQGFNGTSWVTIASLIRNYIDGSSLSSIVYKNTEGYSAIRFLLYSSNTITTTESLSRYKNVIVTINNEDMTYEQYGAMPSPEFESPIKNVSGSANLKIVNKNMFDKNTAKQNYLLNASGQEVASEGNFVSDFILLKANTNYYNNTRGYSNAGFYDLSKNFIERRDFAQNNIVTVEKDCFVKLNGKVENIDTYQFEEGSTESNYTPHKSQSFTFPLADGQKLMKKDYLADDGIHHKRKQVVFDGTEDWNLYDDSNENCISFYIYNIIQFKTNDILCSHFKKIVYGDFTQNGIALNFNNGVYYLMITIEKKELQTHDVNGLKTYLLNLKLAGTPVVIEYYLAEEEIEAYTSEQQAVHNEIKKTAHSYGEQTHIFSTDEISPIFDVEAKAIVQNGKDGTNGTNGVDGQDGKNYSVEVVESTTTTLEIQANKFYKFGEVTELNLTLAEITDNTQLNEFMFEFTSGETATTLTLPDTIKWLETPTIETNKTYQCSIVNNVGVLLGVSNV